MRGMNHVEPDATRIAAPAPPAAAAAATVWPPAVLSGIERELARFVGPLAATLVRRAAQQHTTVDALLAALLPSIESQADRDAFLRTCERRAVMGNVPAAAAPAQAATSVALPVQAAPPERAPGDAAPPADKRADSHAGTALLRAAEALLRALPRLRQLTTLADPAALRAQLLQRLAAFEAEAAGVSPAHLAAARGLLCSFVDETIAASPWGAKGVWAAHALAPTPGQAPDPLDLLQQVQEDPVAHAPLLELCYVCITLGFEGRLRKLPQGALQLEALATRLHALLPSRRGRAGAPRTLSPHWRGLATRGHRDLALLPLWALAAFCGALLLVLWLVLNARLDARARPVFARLAAVPTALQSERVAATHRPRLAAVLPADAQIEIRDDAQRSLITVPADNLFIADSARLEPSAGALLSRIAQALRGQIAQGGEVAVIGHGDDAPPASLQFPTGWHLTRARAQAVADALVAHRVAPVRAEGRAEFEPRAPNTTPAGRAQNRRVEIELRLPRPEELVQ
jgi:type VI secretion system protein ImpK